MKRAAGLSRRLSGPLTVLSAFLLMSGAIRALDGGSEAFAKETEPQIIDVADLPPAMGHADKDHGSAILEPLLKELAMREQNLTERETNLEERLALLARSEARLATQIEALEHAEAQLRETLTIAETAASEDVAKLTAVFQKMKPKDAAKLFEEMDPNFAAGFLAEMAPETAAALMAGLQPDTAYTISVILAGRNAGAPRK